MWHGWAWEGRRSRQHLKRQAAARHRRIFVERLEDRSLLAQLINTGTAADVVFTLPASASTVIFANNTLTSTNGTFDATSFSNPTGSLTINRGNAADTITINALPNFHASLTIGSDAAPLSTITFAGAMTLAADKSLAATATGTISLPNTTSDIATSGAGTISLTTARDIQLSSGSSITTVNGSLTLSANQQLSATSGNFVGIDVNAATIQATGSGVITVQGKGGDSNNGFQHGVQVRTGGKISGGTADALSVQGTGGKSTGDVNAGVSVTDVGSTITTSGSNVKISGLGGGAGTSSASIGVLVVSSGYVTAGGTQRRPLIAFESAS
jgi:hypothetical protein